MRKRLYVGVKVTDQRVFLTSKVKPVQGKTYIYVMGPFRTKAGADWFAKYGSRNNPHCYQVSDAERFAKKEKENAAKYLSQNILPTNRPLLRLSPNSPNV